MICFPNPRRVRYVFSASEREIWQDWLNAHLCKSPWEVTKHVYDNIEKMKATPEQIQSLKSWQSWYVWALELDINVGAQGLKPKFVVRYPSLDEGKWKLGGVIAVGKTSSIITLFENDQFVI
jgi:hypothetical protein